jgi:hypothetical protein
MDILEARRQSHSVRQNPMHDLVFTSTGVEVANMRSRNTTKEMFGFDGQDVANTAKAAGRAITGGVQDAVTGVVGLADDIGQTIDEKIGGLGYLTMGPDGIEYTREKPEGAPRLDEMFDAGLQELGIKVPQGDSGLEALGRGLVQFGAGMIAAPIRGVGYVNTMLRGGFADALFDPEEGNLSTLLKEFGLDNAVLDFLDSKVDEEASAEERLTARMKQALEGTGIALPIDLIVNGFKIVRSDEGAVEIIRNKLSTVTDTITQPGEMPTVGSNLGNIADFKAPTEKEPGIIAFSGSKNDFDEFKLEKVGTGTGEAAFGNGLYFSDLEEIALFYRRSFGSDQKEGKVYQVALDVTPDKLLDYDKPIGQQNQFVQERLRKLVETELNESDAANLGFEPSELNKAKEAMLKGDMSVIYFLNNWAVFRGKDNAAEELLDKYGVKGIKYKANRKDAAIGQVSDSDPNNYVIFDDKLISIMKKYGIVGPVAVTAKSVASNNDEQEGI